MAFTKWNTRLPLKCIGQTGRRFNTWNREHIQTIRNNNSNSLYASHILSTGHTCGTITDTVDIIRTHKKGKRLDILEHYHIHKISESKLRLERHKELPNGATKMATRSRKGERTSTPQNVTLESQTEWQYITYPSLKEIKRCCNPLLHIASTPYPRHVCKQK
jgi:hypothetical protein